MRTYNTICIGGVSIHIGTGSYLQLREDLSDCRSVLVVTDRGIVSNGLVDGITDLLADMGLRVSVYDRTLPNPPLRQAGEVLGLLREDGCEAIVAVGGGSVMDLAKVSGMLHTNGGDLREYVHSQASPRHVRVAPLPLYSIPTTSGTGSEVTQYAVITDEESREKITVGNPLLVSRAVYLDTRFTVSMPPSVTANSGIDALAHALEAYTSRRITDAPGSSVISDTLALKAIELVWENLEAAYHDGSNVHARMNMMLASTMAGLITQAGSGAAHGLSHVLTSRYDIPHGAAIGALLPQVMAYNMPACGDRYGEVAAYCGLGSADELAIHLAGLMARLNVRPLGAYIKDGYALRELAEIAARDKCTTINARAVGVEDALALYEASM